MAGLPPISRLIVIALKMEIAPLALSLSKGRLRFDRLTANGVLNVDYSKDSIFMLRGADFNQHDGFPHNLCLRRQVAGIQIYPCGFLLPQE